MIENLPVEVLILIVGVLTVAAAYGGATSPGSEGKDRDGRPVYTDKFQAMLSGLVAGTIAIVALALAFRAAG